MARPCFKFFDKSGSEVVETMLVKEFHLRDCCPIKFDQTFATKVEKKYFSGFDAFVGDSIVYFTDDPDLLNPLSVLVPAEVITGRFEDERMTFSTEKLQFSDCKIYQGEKIKTAHEFFSTDRMVLHENLLSLHSNIKLFGRPSVVKDLIMGCNTQQNILTGAEQILLEPEPDMGKLMSYVGIGDGLTPSFDDLLTGMILADRHFAQNRIKIPDGFIEAIKSKTTRQSVQQIQFACLGLLNMGFERFVQNIGRARVKSAQIVRLLNRGHTSGTDILCGLWLYLTKQVIINR